MMSDAFGPMLERALAWIASLGPWAPLAFILCYVAASVLFIPGVFFTWGAGIVFGVLRGSILVSIGSTLGASAAFLVGRYLARDWVERKIAGNPRLTILDEAVAREGWKIVGLTRLSPAFPFTLLNYAYGLTKIPFREYFLASWFGMIPAAVLHVYLGSLARDLAELDAGHRARTPTEWAFYAGGLAATLAVTIYVTRIAHRALAERVAT